MPMTKSRRSLSARTPSRKPALKRAAAGKPRSAKAGIARRERGPEAGEGRLRRRPGGRRELDEVASPSGPRRPTGSPSTSRPPARTGRLMPGAGARGRRRGAPARGGTTAPAPGRRSGDARLSERLGRPRGLRRRPRGTFCWPRPPASCASISASIAASSRRSISSRTSSDGGSTLPAEVVVVGSSLGAEQRRERAPGLILEARETAAGSIWVTPRMSPSTASRSDAPQDGHSRPRPDTVAEHHGQVGRLAGSAASCAGLMCAATPTRSWPAASTRCRTRRD